jgi:hypothetical protein
MKALAAVLVALTLAACEAPRGSPRGTTPPLSKAATRTVVEPTTRPPELTITDALFRPPRHPHWITGTLTGLGHQPLQMCPQTGESAPPACIGPGLRITLHGSSSRFRRQVYHALYNDPNVSLYGIVRHGDLIVRYEAVPPCHERCINHRPERNH